MGAKGRGQGLTEKGIAGDASRVLGLGSDGAVVRFWC